MAADADVAATITSAPPTTTAAVTAANPDRHPRRHLAVRANPTGMASLLSLIWNLRHEARRIGADAAGTRTDRLNLSFQLAVQVGAMPAPLPLPWNPNSVTWPDPSRPL
ncbi:hypothetical protein Prum_013630 [Phytohabitans rumicis]|uniref:Uncharacterized protein n=1 Tax=Phytohabitans rumicis TaxID=1076125 RepID=A0A6V8KZ42_9ACTN|nr:hypothetical protein Prum_013630 [Phytohabitans rumicis]